MDWQSLWDGKFIKLDFQNKRKAKDNGEIVFLATAYYKIENDGKVVGNWFDNRGVSFPLRGTINDNVMTILWGSEETEKGKTIYHYHINSDKITVEDFILNKGEYFKFGNAIYRAN
ncbi:uncharacterized protein YifN (PemK superfamily) [Aquimarina sp. EL_43]|uniref:hypothetical protein n=1 Tax=unclassified Aquimarina TaxID=2627091 RepID=UPI0018CB4B17|nr:MULTISPECIES: hypothetical protein [unclassified Aquimarina]MBG6129486.1 uncharacterized protein YifN (PemK superfamily) [Aquimarina sp. EL_35]MBG6150551.1 uncharacterized protein YifN (PemK superfamily) [Aquimarina sp. EL_32]MBG6168141.1 uncharacterized protein YifN (PemK superfamily) [Aquimarina sp. EL_43]